MENKNKEYKKIVDTQAKRIKDISTVECVVCKDNKNHIYGNKGGEYSKLVY